MGFAQVGSYLITPGPKSRSSDFKPRAFPGMPGCLPQPGDSSLELARGRGRPFLSPCALKGP